MELLAGLLLSIARKVACELILVVVDMCPFLFGHYECFSHRAFPIALFTAQALSSTLRNVRERAPVPGPGEILEVLWFNGQVLVHCDQRLPKGVQSRGEDKCHSGSVGVFLVLLCSYGEQIQLASC